MSKAHAHEPKGITKVLCKGKKLCVVHMYGCVKVCVVTMSQVWECVVGVSKGGKVCVSAGKGTSKGKGVGCSSNLSPAWEH